MSKNIHTAIATHTNKPIGIEDALEVRDSVYFICDDCGLPVIAHKQSKTEANAHFEHKVVNLHCKY